MTVTRSCRAVLAAGAKGQGECYGGVLDEYSADSGLAYCRVDGKRESLIYRPADGEQAVLAADTYVMSPHFVAGLLVWTERHGSAWRTRYVDVRGPSPGKARALRTAGRAMGFASAPTGDGGAWLTWEERNGKRTRLRMAAVRDGRIAEARDADDGEYNAYDPAVAVAADGTVYLAYTAFAWGNYRTMLRAFDPDGAPLGEARRVSNHAAACLYPSVAAASGGGVWVGFSVLGEDPIGNEPPYVQHYRRQAQLAMFKRMGLLHVLRFDGEGMLGPVAPVTPHTAQGPLAAGKVYPSTGATRSRLFEDPAGRLWALVRQHLALGDEVAYEREVDSLPPRPVGGRQSAARNNYPALVLHRLDDRQWTGPEKLISCTHVEGAISCRLDGRRLRVGFTEDRRGTSWYRGGEWFAPQGLGVGVAEVELGETPPPQYELRLYHPTARPGPGIEEPTLPPHSELQPGPDGLRCLLGQTHTHTELSVCVRSCDGEGHVNYRFMQDVQHLDFGGTTDHTEQMWHTEMLLTRKLAEWYHFPGEFVALPAYEWAGTYKQMSYEGGPFGHVNPIWLSDEGDLEMYVDCEEDGPGCSLPRLWRQYRGQPVIAPPHHSADFMHPFRWEFLDAELCPVVEIFQDHRASAEQPGAPGVGTYAHQQWGGWVTEALDHDKRFGFIGGGDHFGVALAGVWASELTRAGLLEAFRARRTFATTGLSACVDFRCNGLPQGSEVVCKPDGQEAQFALNVRAAETIDEVQVVRNGQDVDRLGVADTSFAHQWRAECGPNGEYWYVRVIFANGEIAWSSPIWTAQG